MDLKSMNPMVLGALIFMATIAIAAAYQYNYIPDSNIFMDIVAEYTATDPLNASNGTFAGGVTIGTSGTGSLNITTINVTSSHSTACPGDVLIYDDGTATYFCGRTSILSLE